MGSCLSSAPEEDVRMEELQRWVYQLHTKKEREDLILHLITLFDEAEGGARDEALTTLANVIHIVNATK